MMSTIRSVTLAATLGAVIVSATTVEARGEEFQCQRGDQVRRVELRLADDADQLPCEVVYWLDTEAPGQPQSLWNAQNQLDYCRDKAQLMVERLESAGWACDAGDDDALAPPTAAGPESPRPAPAASDSSRAAEPAATRGQPDLATLRAALDRDVQRLEELTADSSGGFATDGAALGDLNGDGLEDAAVLLTHSTEGEEPTHYLLAYVFVGETFRPIARASIEAFYQNFADVKIEGVTEGAVQILLHVPRADDPPCCPSGRRQATFGLQDREFVLLKEIDRGA
jgi:hypothetical protein